VWGATPKPRSGGSVFPFLASARLPGRYLRKSQRRNKDVGKSKTRRQTRRVCHQKTVGLAIRWLQCLNYHTAQRLLNGWRRSFKQIKRHRPNPSITQTSPAHAYQGAHATTQITYDSKTYTKETL